MNRPMEDRLRAAFDAKTSQVTGASLARSAPDLDGGVDEPVSDTLGTQTALDRPGSARWLKPVTAAAAAAAIAAVAGGLYVGTNRAATTLGYPTTSAPAPAPQPTARTPATASSIPSAQSSAPTTATSTTAPTSTGRNSPVTILTSIFGGDYTARPQSPSGFGGDLTLTPGSALAAALPAGYEAAVSLHLLSGTSDSIRGPVDTTTSLCGARVEKGATMKACIPQTIGGLNVQRSEFDAPNTQIGTWANLRILYGRPDKQVQYAEITIWNTAHTTTAQERATAAAWLHAQNNKIATAATAAAS